MKFPKNKPKTVTYRSYKQFDENKFKSDIKKFMNVKFNFTEFNNTFLKLLDKHAPLKKRIIRANEVPYMTKALRKAIMRRSQLETKYHKHKTDEYKLLYKKQKNYVSRLYKKERRRFFENLDIKSFLDNKKFWKNVKPFF